MTTRPARVAWIVKRCLGNRRSERSGRQFDTRRLRCVSRSSSFIGRLAFFLERAFAPVTRSLVLESGPHWAGATYG